MNTNGDESNRCFFISVYSHSFVVPQAGRFGQGQSPDPRGFLHSVQSSPGQPTLSFNHDKPPGKSTSSGVRTRCRNTPRYLKLFALVFMVFAGTSGCERPSPTDVSTANSGSQINDGTIEQGVVEARPTERAHESFVGSQACRECHAGICSSYDLHPMGNSMSSAVAGTTFADGESLASIAIPGTAGATAQLTYQIEKSGPNVVHHECVLTPDGDVIYDHAVPVHFSIGSGKRGRSFVVNRDGMLFMSPLSWYSQESRWDLSPGYAQRNLHFGRRVIDACVSCHAGRVDRLEKSYSRYESTPFLEESIGCERCHGAGGRHVEFHALAQTGPDPIVNPASLPSRQRDHVCFQCHLIGEYRFLRFGRNDFDFRPGDDLTDIWTIVLRKTDDGDESAAVSQAEQMLQSICYVKSDGALGCISCHDPHSLPKLNNVSSFYREKCLACHDDDGTTCSESLTVRGLPEFDDSCIACHMQRFEANDIPHTSQTDHRILRKRLPAPPQDSTTPRLQLRFFGEDAGTIPPAELERARAMLLTVGAEITTDRVMARQAIEMLAAWLSMTPNDVTVLERLGAAYRVAGDDESARRTWQRGLEQQPEHEEILSSLFVLCDETRDYAAALDYGNRILAVNPWEFEYHYRMAKIYEKAGDTPAAILSAEKAMELNPAEHEIVLWLANRYQAIGDAQKARTLRKRYDLLTGTQ
jgi:Cytochrome c554 and c-prime